ncbi:hypothetical protein GTP27_17755 [Pseudoduganella sp. CY13W]|uniref:Uncharacterized protein n=2 Tax=Duganella qianjiadongensis TaxID=2692176 RepID=A0ABW9VNL4_9BURK|nr:hypothetical protein [Duganella qianjiadongensis]
MVQDQEGAIQLFSPKDVVNVSSSESSSASKDATNADKATDPKKPNKKDMPTTKSIIGPVDPVSFARLINSNATDLDEALRLFGTNCNVSTNEQCRLLRNSAQDRLIASSNAICRDYKNTLKRAHAETNFAYGGLATLFGGIGAVTTAVNPARLFAGAASITTGIRAEMNQSMYSMLAIEIVTKAIDKARTDALKDIDLNQRKEIGNYNLERAIADAEEYHSRCSLLAGLQEASASVAQSSIGLKTLNQTLEDLGQTAQIQVGRKKYSLYSSNQVFISKVCSALNDDYDTFIKGQGIKLQLTEFSDLDSKWKEFINKDENCKSGAGNPTDTEWTNLISQFSKTQDDAERDKVLGQIAAQQAKAAALEQFLKTNFSSITAALQNRATVVQQIYTQRTEIATSLSSFKTAVLATSPATTNTYNFKDLKALAARVRNVLELIARTKAPLTADEQVTVKTALAPVDALTLESSASDLESAQNKFGAAVTILVGWSVK